MSLRNLLIFFGIALLMQITMLNLLAIGGYTPNLILSLTIVILFVFHEGYKCIPFAILGMLLLDVFVGQYVGVRALSLFLIAGIILIIRRQLNTEQWKPMLVTGVIGTFLYDLVYWSALKILGMKFTFSMFVLRQPGYILYNSVIIIGLFFLFMIVVKKREKSRYEQ